jgi:hypothetical protein
VLEGTYYRFEAAPLESNNWRTIFTLRHDDRPEIPRDQVRFINDETAYAFMGHIFAASTDAGVTWSVWDAERELKDGLCSRLCFIEAIDIKVDGTGTMKVVPVSDRPGPVPELRTKDFGFHWSMQ